MSGISVHIHLLALAASLKSHHLYVCTRHWGVRCWQLYKWLCAANVWFMRWTAQWDGVVGGKNQFHKMLRRLQLLWVNARPKWRSRIHAQTWTKHQLYLQAPNHTRTRLHTDVWMLHLVLKIVDIWNSHSD